MKTQLSFSLPPWQSFMVLTCLIACFLPIHAQIAEPNEHWIRSYGREWIDNNGAQQQGVEWSWSIEQTSDGGYISAGFSNDGNMNNTSPALAEVIPALTKMSPHGEEQWTVTFEIGGEDNYGFFFQVIEVEDGYVAIGRKRFDILPSEPGYCGISLQDKILVVKVDYNGNKVIENGISLGCGAYGTGIQQLPNGSFAFTGYRTTVTTSPAGYDIILGFLSSNLTLTSANFFDSGNHTNGNNRNDRANSIALTHNAQGVHDGYVIAGWQEELDAEEMPFSIDNNDPGGSVSIPFGTIDHNAWVFKTDLTGQQVLWNYILDSDVLPPSWYDFEEPGSCSPQPGDAWHHSDPDAPSQDEGRSIIELSDGTFALTVACNTTLIRATSSALPCYTPSGVGHGEYLSADIALIRLDQNGNEIYNKNIAHFAGDDWVPQVEETLDGEVVVIGTTAFAGDGTNPATIKGPMQDPILIKTENALSNSPQIAWRKVTYWTGSMGMCGFSVDVCNDGGFAVSGNNTVNNEDWQFYKLYSDCQTNIPLDPFFDVTSPYSVLGVENWNSNRKVMAEVVVPNGATLNITNSTIEFGDVRQLNDYRDLASGAAGTVHPRIRVEKGGTLVVTRSVLRGIESCGASNMWEGIMVEGDPNAGPGVQGKIVINSSTIQDAIKGIRVGGITYNANGHPHTTGFKGGGIVQADGTTFRNCRRSVHFTTYPYSVNNMNQTQSFFTSCTFETTTPLVDPDYISENNDDLTSFLHGQPLGVNVHLSFWNTHGVDIKGCSFVNNLDLPPSLKGIGIGSFDGSYTLERDCFNQGSCTGSKNTFQNLYYGVEALSGGATSVVNISRSDFIDCSKGIRMEGMQFPSITRNTFSVPFQQDFDEMTYGIYMEECDGYEIEGNELNGPEELEGTFGVWIQNDDPNNNYSANVVYRNTFNMFFQSSTGSGENRGVNKYEGLVFKCNRYGELGHGIVSQLPPGIAEMQGFVSNMTTPAGNQFDGGDPFSSINIINMNDPITYTYHNSQNTFPNFISGPVTLQSGGVPFEIVESCPSSFPGDIDDGGPLRIASQGQEIDLEGLDRRIQKLEASYEMNPSEELELELAKLKRDRSWEVNRLVRFYLNASDEESMNKLIELLSKEQTPEATSQLLTIYMQQGEWEAARLAIEKLKQEASYQDYAQLQSLILQWKQGEGSMFDLETDEGLQAQLQVWAENPRSSASIHAKAIRKWVLGIESEEILAQVNVQSLSDSREETLPLISQTLSLAPNPAINYVQLRARLAEAGSYTLLSLQGQILKHASLQAGEQEMIIDLSDLASGVYIVKVQGEAGEEEVQKLIVK